MTIYELGHGKSFVKRFNSSLGPKTKLITSIPKPHKSTTR